MRLTTTSHHRRRQIRLWWLLASVSAIGIACALFAVRLGQARIQRATIESLRTLGLECYYDYQTISALPQIAPGPWPVLSDDVAVIRLDGERWKVWPASRTVRLEGLAEPGSWDNRGKGELLLEGADSPCELGEVRLLLTETPPDPIGPALVQASLLRCQWGWEWTSPEARQTIDQRMWDLISKVPVKTEAWGE